MGKFYRGRNDGFTKKVDISHLYRIGKATVQLRKIGEQMQNTAMLKEVEEIEAIAEEEINGKTETSEATELTDSE